MPDAAAEEICTNISQPLAIKQLLMLAEMARTGDDGTIEVPSFLEVLHTMDL